jgi:ferredoxin
LAKRKELVKAGKLTPQGWLVLRKISQAFFLLVFLVFFQWSRREFYLNPAAAANLKQKLINIPLKMDPLVMLSQVLASRVFLAGSLLAIITITLTLLLGRVWCGWFCPVGTLLDWLPLRSWKKNQPELGEGLRGIKYVLLLVILLAAVFTNLTLLILDPLTILYRSLTTAIWPGLDRIITALELTLYSVPFLQPVIGMFDSLIRPAVFPANPAIYRYGSLYFGFFIGMIVLNLLAPRFWCRYLCPLGGLLGVLGKFSLVHCEVADTCSTCGVCFNKCPTGAIQTRPEVFCDPGECTMCLACAVDCPGGAISYPARSSQFINQPYDINRQKAILSLGTAVVGVSLLDRKFGTVEAPLDLLRPPGVINEIFLAKCIRCGECSTVCPTNAIQMAISEAGLEGFWTPVLVPRIGYCDYSCNACGQVCPVEAIPPLPLEQKREQVIGLADVDRTRCLPWAEDTECIVCEEMCPIPDKAIELDMSVIRSAEGELITLQKPVVIPSMCIGCGICETRCPVPGAAAIRVEHRPDQPQPEVSRGFLTKAGMMLS